MKVIKEVEKIIKSNDNFKLVEIDKEYHNKLGKEYQNFRSVRIEIRDKENVYVLYIDTGSLKISKVKV